MNIIKGKRGILLIVLLSFFYIYNINALLPDITNLNVEVYGAYGNNVKIEWNYAAYGVTCTPDWQCSEWSFCTNDQQTRICNDLNGCDPNNNQRTETQACISSYGSYGVCVDECSQDSKECSGNGYRTCGNYDSDSCLEWGNVISCSSNEICENGGCISQEGSYGSYGGYGTGAEGFVVRNTINKITGKSFFDIFKNTFNNIINVFRG
ncbi:MAG: hypothetical protein AAB907_03360, partial [Patescibacteria group bacterium]